MYIKKIFICTAGLVTFGSLGFYCLMSVICMLEPSRYPYFFPFCIGMGIISFFLCVLLFLSDINFIIEYVKEENDHKKKLKSALKISAAEIVSLVLLTLPMCILWNFLCEIAGSLF